MNKLLKLFGLVTIDQYDKDICGYKDGVSFYKVKLEECRKRNLFLTNKLNDTAERDLKTGRFTKRKVMY